MKQLILFLLLGTCNTLFAQHTKLIQEAMNNYDYEKAIMLIDKEQPTTELLFQKGKALKSLGRNTEALHTFRQIIAGDSLNQRAFIEAAECCKQSAKYQDALKYYQKAIDIHPDNKYVRIQYISLLCNLQQYEEAFGESSVLAETDSSAVILHLQAQSLEGRTGFLDAALGCYHVIQDKYPDDYLAAAKLGQIYNAMQFYEYAIEATEKYREADTTNVVVNRQNAQAYCLSGDYPMAIKRYEYLVGQRDSSFHTYYYLGVSYYATEKFYEAHDMLEIARKYDPENVNLLYYLGRACAKTSWKKQGIEYLETAIDLSLPKDSAMTRLYKGLRDCCRLGREPAKAIQAAKDQYKYDKTNHKLLYDIAIDYLFMKDNKNATHYLEAFLKTRPKDTKETAIEINKKGEVEVNMEYYYRSAMETLKKLKQKAKEEDFFKNGTLSKE
ncbi:tetratricopeptide repeat protein [Bacteroides salyersiae]|uniref:tetratricopeptide repeat protein n=1 Tax=Bacteroides salyersiae TaxID=291644 RepID=UPI001C3953DD|nr:tetratricopeptide repeat protein [Bacteroides salyersiae]MBV4205883.1 tetratricopeptide repeat protein [Bacteroides salyersiae]MCB6651002.1 tetratricopeptide repeat protein [Bacteroides salyersiae]